jgi:hypothetical protein
MEFAFAPQLVTDSGFRDYPDHKEVPGQIPTNPYKDSGVWGCRRDWTKECRHGGQRRRQLYMGDLRIGGLDRPDET